MKPELQQILAAADLRGWEEVGVEYGARQLAVRVPPGTVTLAMKDTVPLRDPGAAIREAISRPIGTPPLETLVARRGKDPASLTVSIAVSDITRPAWNLPASSNSAYMR